MIGMSNHILSRVFGFHYRSQKVIGSLPRVYSCLGYIHWNSCIFNNWGEMTPVTCFQGHKKGVRTPFRPQLVGHGALESWDQGLNKMVIFFRSSIRSMRGSSEESSTCNFPWYHMFYGSFFMFFLWYNSLSLGIQSYSQLMIGMSNHILSRVFGFHYRSQKVIGSLPRVYSCLGYIHWNSCIFNNWGEMTPVTCFQGHKKG